MQQTRALHIGLLLCVVLICINVSDAAKSKGGVSTRGGGGGGGGGGLDLGGFDLGSLLQGLGSTKDGGLQFKFHGKYCGLGHGDATYKDEPIDDIDAICKLHDQCYDNQQYSDCLCDHDFVRDMKAAAANPKTANDLKSKASLMAAWFEGSSCKCKDEEGLVKELTGASILQKSKCKHIPKLVKEELYFISLFLLFIFNELRFLLLN